ncbi:hypothetical protein OCD90_03455 [Bacillus pacificus]|nr:hypothetical protein [Bacillus pacificus]MCU5004288.1 hypothetical protein [Bacillus pacificus]MCU5254845.1 hypothetical protein [Bacillus pacificus]MCU5560297.1 hypothetical protein [Bacillus pacificus]
MDLHSLNDNNTKKALEGFLKVVEKAQKEENEKSKKPNKVDE